MAARWYQLANDLPYYPLLVGYEVASAGDRDVRLAAARYQMATGVRGAVMYRWAAMDDEIVMPLEIEHWLTAEFMRLAEAVASEYPEVVARARIRFEQPPGTRAPILEAIADEHLARIYVPPQTVAVAWLNSARPLLPMLESFLLDPQRTRRELTFCHTIFPRCEMSSVDSLSYEWHEEIDAVGERLQTAFGFLFAHELAHLILRNETEMVADCHAVAILKRARGSVDLGILEDIFAAAVAEPEIYWRFGWEDDLAARLAHRIQYIPEWERVIDIGGEASCLSHFHSLPEHPLNH